MRRQLTIALSALSLLLLACSSSGSPAASSAGASTGDATTVTITDAASPGKFEPGTLTIKVGQTVRFVSQSSAAHTVEWKAGGFPTSDTIQKGGTPYTTPAFTTAGTFDYICGIHGASMSGSIVVQP